MASEFVENLCGKLRGSFDRHAPAHYAAAAIADAIDERIAAALDTDDRPTGDGARATLIIADELEDHGGDLPEDVARWVREHAEFEQALDDLADRWGDSHDHAKADVIGALLAVDRVVRLHRTRRDG